MTPCVLLIVWLLERENRNTRLGVMQFVILVKFVVKVAPVSRVKCVIVNVESVI